MHQTHNQKHKKSLFFLGIVLSALLIAGCSPVPPKSSSETGSKATELEFSTSQNLVELSEAQLKGLLKEAQNAQGGDDMFFSISARNAVAIPTAAPVAQESADSAKISYDGGAGSSYSETNVQVEGVDEADIIKTDGDYIYILSSNKLVVVDARNPENPQKGEEFALAKTNAEYARNFFVSKDKIVVFLDASERTLYLPPYEILPQDQYRSVTRIKVIDASDRDDLEVVEEHTLSGSYTESRLIDGVVYAVTQEYAGSPDYPNLPYITTSVGKNEKRIAPQMYTFENPETNYHFTTVTSLQANTGEVIDSESYLLGYAATVMVSEDNIFIAYEQHPRWWWNNQASEDNARERFVTVVVPALPAEVKSSIESILSQNLELAEEWDKVSAVLESFFAQIREDRALEDRYAETFEQILDDLAEYDARRLLEERKTSIHRISINNGAIAYEDSGAVEGRLLNQFSMDEHDGYLRVATTVDIWAQKRIQYNNVYTLDIANMDIAGKIEGIAEDESVFSARFMGDSLYLVTFEQVDPFFVIDLSDPKNPVVKGELKLPGFSNYLHPWGEHHIIGVGKETDFDGKRVRIEGLKVALFNVEDPENPILVDSVTVGDQGSDSAALYDHKAFLFVPERNLLVLPVTEVTQDEEISQYRYRTSSWHGAYVWHVTEDGFTEEGRVRHGRSDSFYWNWYDQTTVLRSLFIDNVLFTLSTDVLKANDLDNELTALATISMPKEEEQDFPAGDPRPLIKPGVAVSEPAVLW